MSDIWFMLKDTDRYLYHYTRARTVAKLILPTQALRLSRFQNLNDPKETKNFRLSAVAWADDMLPSTIDELARTLKRDWRVACFVRDPAEASFAGKGALGVQQLQAMHERGHSRPRMWAQYADNHAGACLVFDKAKLGSAFETLGAKTGLKILSGAVQYANVQVAPSLRHGPFTVNMNDVRAYGIEEAARRHGEQFWRQLFLVKNIDWEAEREFRWLLAGPCEGDLYLPIADSLQGVLLGSQFPEALIDSVHKHAHTLGARVARMDWNNGIPEINLIAPRQSRAWLDRIARRLAWDG